MDSIDNTTRELLLALYANPNYGPGIMSILPQADMVPSEARPLYGALIKNGLTVGTLDYGLLETDVGNDEYAQGVIGKYQFAAASGKYADAAGTVTEYAKRVRRYRDLSALSGTLIRLGEEFVSRAEVEIGVAVARVIGSVEEIARGSESSDLDLSVAVNEALLIAEGWRDGISTDYITSGYDEFDLKFGGYAAGEMFVFGGHTGGGKTALLVDAMRRYGLKNYEAEDAPKLLVFSCEMSRAKIVHRLACCLSGISMTGLRPRNGMSAASPESMSLFFRALKFIKKLPIIIDDTPDPTWEHMFSTCKAVEAQFGLAGCWVDYMEKVQVVGAMSEELRVSKIAEGLKKLAKILNIPVGVLSQYSRRAYSPGELGGRPQNEWLRYSGKIEQEAAQIFHLHWTDYFVKRNVLDYYKDTDPGMHVICTKNRDGMAGEVKLVFRPELFRFYDPSEMQALSV